MRIYAYETAPNHHPERKRKHSEAYLSTSRYKFWPPRHSPYPVRETHYYEGCSDFITSAEAVEDGRMGGWPQLEETSKSWPFLTIITTAI